MSFKNAVGRIDTTSVSRPVCMRILRPSMARHPYTESGLMGIVATIVVVELIIGGANADALSNHGKSPLMQLASMVLRVLWRNSPGVSGRTETETFSFAIFLPKSTP